MSPSMCIQKENHTTLGLAADNSRKERVSFQGKLKDPLIFRDAMLMLREIVISGKEIEKKERKEFFAWLNQEIERRIQLHEKYAPKVREELTTKMKEEEGKRREKEEEIKQLRKVLNKMQKEIDELSVWKDYNKLEREFWKFIKEKDYDLWFVLDPVITVHPDEVSFEAFSIDESTYGCLSIPIQEFELLKTPSLGTTNIDFSAKLAKEIERFRTDTDVTLSVNPDGFTVDMGVMPEHIEKKIDLPETWIKGFCQVSSAACLNGVDVELTPADFYDICSFLRRHKAKKSPRYMKWILEPKKRVRIIFEPYHTELILHAVYQGERKREEKIWGRRRWLVAERLIPLAKSFHVRLLGFGMPQFIIADLGVMKMTIGFSSWSSNDWVKGTAFNIMAGFVSEGNYPDVYRLLQKKRGLSIKEIQEQLRISAQEGTTKSGIGMMLKKGEAYYDVTTDKVRFRQLCSEPIPEELYKVTGMERKVNKLQNASLDSFCAVRLENGDYCFSHEYVEKDNYGKNTTRKAELVIDEDGQIKTVSCTCAEFQKGDRNISDPCAHILALYLMSFKFFGLPFETGKNYKINDIMEMLL